MMLHSERLSPELVENRTAQLSDFMAEAAAQPALTTPLSCSQALPRCGQP